MENEYTAYNFSCSVIYLLKIIKIDGHLTVLTRKVCAAFFRHGVCVAYTSIRADDCLLYSLDSIDTQ